MATEVSVNQKIFEDFPTFRRGITVAWGFENREPCKDLEEELGESIEEVRSRAPDLASAAFADWDSAHKAFGSKPKRFPPAHKSLAKRVLKGGKLPFISNVVAVMTITSLRHLLPVGGDDAALSGRELMLRKADGTETFEGLRSQEIENPLKGEVIYVNEKGVVLCRRWNWRNSKVTAIRDTSDCIIMNSDALGEDSKGRATAARDEVSRLLESHCGAQTATALISPENRKLIIDLESGSKLVCKK